MRHTLRLLLAATILLLATGCGTDRGGDSATEPPAPTTDDTPAATAPEVVDILHQTAAGGEATELAVDLSTPAGVDELVAPVSGGGLDGLVRDRVTDVDVPAGQRLMGAIVSVGCDVPVDVKVIPVGDAVRLEPIFQGKPMLECLAAVTSIALVLVAD